MTKKKNSKQIDNTFNRIFGNNENLKEFVSLAFSKYTEDGNFEVFYRALKLAIKSKGTFVEFAKKVKISKHCLHDILDGKKETKMSTIARILKELGLTLKIVY